MRVCAHTGGLPARHVASTDHMSTGRALSEVRGLYSDRPESEWPNLTHRGRIETERHSAASWPPRERSRSPIHSRQNRARESSTGKQRTRGTESLDRHGTRDRSKSSSKSHSSKDRNTSFSSRRSSADNSGNRHQRKSSRSSSQSGHHSSSRRRSSSSSSSSSSSTSSSTSGSKSSSTDNGSSPPPSYGYKHALPSQKYFGDWTGNGESDHEDESVPRFKMEFNCEVCGISTTNFEALQIHFAGSRHTKNLRKVGYGKTFKSMHEVRDPQLSGKILRCLLCDVILTEAEVSIHVGCTTHLSALEKAEDRFKDMDPDKWFVEVTKTSEKTKDGFHCSLCDVTLPNFDGFQTHIRGKRHLKAVKLSSGGDTVDANTLQVWCNICNIYCTNQESLDIHLKGKRHQKTLKNKGFIQEGTPKTGSNSAAGSSSAVVNNPFVASNAPKIREIRCTLCDVVLSNNTEIQAHLSTTEHYMALRKAPGKLRKEMFVPV